MRSFGELMKELGFNPEASEDVQRAFLKHLAKASAEQVTPEPKVMTKKKNAPEQLEFKFEENELPPKKVS
jgi:hypothetical protein